MRHANKRRMVLGATVAMTLVAASCGGDDGGSGGLLGGESSSSFCDLARSVDAQSTALGSALTAGNADTLESALKSIVSTAEAALKKAPSEIKDDLKTSLDGLKEFQKIAKDNDYDVKKIDADPDFAALEEADSTAEDNIDSYLADECGIDASDAPGDDSTDDGSEASIPTDANDALIATYKQIFPGLEDDQIRCLVTKGMDLTQAGADPSQFQQILDDCDIDLADLQPEG